LELVGLAEAIGALHRNQEQTTENREQYCARSGVVLCSLFLALSTLAMPATNFAALIADGQTPTALQAAALQYCAPVLGFHSFEEAMFTTTRNAFWLPGSLRHEFVYLSPAGRACHAGINHDHVVCLGQGATMN
jgi:hypothetical protein